jgi:Tfp pilus assembly protein FimT
LRKKKKKREGFVKEKKPATFAMPSASQLVAQQSLQINNEPLIIAALLRYSRQTKLCDPLNACPS